MFHMYDKNIYKCDVTCSLPLPCNTFSDPIPTRAWCTLWTPRSCLFCYRGSQRYTTL